MLAKVIKHEYQATKLIFWIATAVAFVPGFFMFLIYCLPFSGENILATAITLMIISCFVANGFAFIYLLIRYYQTMHGQASYQTFTTPVSPRTIYWGKALYWMLTIIFLSLIFLLWGCVYFYLAADAWHFTLTGLMIELFETQVQSISPMVYLGFFLFFLFYVISSVINWSFIITVGNSWKFRNAGPVGGPIIVAIVYGVIGSIFSILTTLLPGIITLEVNTSSNSVGFVLEGGRMHAEHMVFGVWDTLYGFLATIILYVIIDYLLNKRLELR